MDYLVDEHSGGVIESLDGLTHGFGASLLSEPLSQGPPSPPFLGPSMPVAHDRWDWLRATLEMTPEQAEIMDVLIEWASNAYG